MSTPLLVPHTAGCPLRGIGHTDAAKRVSDAVNLHMLASDAGWAWDNVKGRFMAFRLENGASDGTLYDTKQDAVRHQGDEFLCMYLKLHAGGMSACEAEIMLKIHRQAYDNGFRLADPDSKTGGRDIIPRMATDKALAQIRALNRGRN
jgi:hypothetical protein